MTKHAFPNLPALLTVEQVAEQLGISRARTYELIMGKRGERPAIPSVTVGRLRRVTSADLGDYITGLKADAQAASDTSPTAS